MRALPLVLVAAACASPAIVDDTPPDAGAPTVLSDAGTDAVDAGTDVDAGTPPETFTGVLLGGPGPYPGAIAGLAYRSGATSGVTGADGTFRWESGQKVTFAAGDVILAEVDGAAKRTPFALANDAACAATESLKRLLVALETLDADHDPTNGLAITAPATTPTRRLADLSDADFRAFLGTYGTPPDPLAALDRFIAQVDDETWSELSMEQFGTTDSAFRSQGIASDGTNVWFSWRYGLQVTDLQFHTGVKNNLAIPFEFSNPLQSSPSDHIGDIDVFGDTLYAPVEDSKRYEHPRILLFSKDQLDYTGTHFDLPANLLTEGVPWVAVDGPAGLAYAAEWNPTTSLLEFNLADFSLKRQVPLRQALGRIQGAKVWHGMLYAHADDAGKAVYKVNRETGTVIPLVSGTWQGEQEGVAFFDLPDGSTMQSINATADAKNIELHHLKRTRVPLREEVCPGG